ADAARRAPRALSGLSALIVAAVTVPMAYVVLRAFEGGFGSYADAVFTARMLGLLWRTAILVAGTLAVTVPIALGAGWLVVRTDLKHKQFWATVLALPLVFPSYVAAFAMIAVLGPSGPLQSLLDPLGVDRLPEIVYGFSGALIVLSLFTYPYIYLLVVPAWRGLDASFEESGRTLGAGPLKTWFRVVLPQLRAPLFGGGLLVALYVVSDFGAVSLLRYNTLTLSVFNAYRSLFDRTIAAATSTVLIAVAILLVVLQARAQRRMRAVRRGVTRPSAAVRLGRAQGPAQIALALFALATVGVPAGVVIGWGVRALSVGNPLGTIGDALGHSLQVSLLAAVAASTLAIPVPVAIWSVRFPNRTSRLAERLCYSGYALPGLVVALALVFFTTRHAGFLYQTVALLVAAYIVRFLPEALSATRSALSDVAPDFEEAARSLGHS
ncbi:MAG: ABC transporter permease subunit, partial [Acidobacteria bacterium]|nr:ABC transporter permease subunit [Acidobacteriota bacterium]NIQ84182.1 ABC transporter permease subunit [Acidobacteriota bacterium]